MNESPFVKNRTARAAALGLSSGLPERFILAPEEACLHSVCTTTLGRVIVGMILGDGSSTRRKMTQISAFRLLNPKSPEVGDLAVQTSFPGKKMCLGFWKPNDIYKIQAILSPGPHPETSDGTTGNLSPK